VKQYLNMERYDKKGKGRKNENKGHIPTNICASDHVIQKFRSEHIDMPQFIDIFHNFGPHNFQLSSAFYRPCSRIFQEGLHVAAVVQQ